MSFTLRPAVRENVPLLVGLAGGTGSGKTYTAMLLAKGLAGGQRFAVIDTESGRAKAYADEFSFDQGELVAPFTPDSYAKAIVAIDAMKKYPVIVVDSASHEYAGDGGILDMQEEELARMAGNDYGKREACKMASWVKPKMAHKAFMSKLLQIRAHLILCYRAEPKTEMLKKDGKTVVQAKQGLTGLDGWFPICEKNMPYELTAYFLLMAEKPGVPQPIKLMEKHRGFFPVGKPITEEAGRQLAAWARGVSSVSAAPNSGQGDNGASEGPGVRRDGNTLSPDAAVPKDKYDDMFAWLSESPERMKAGRDVLKTLGYTSFKQLKTGDLKAIYDCEKAPVRI